MACVISNLGAQIHAHFEPAPYLSKLERLVYLGNPAGKKYCCECVIHCVVKEWIPSRSEILLQRITESQNRRGWKGPLGISYSSPPAKAVSPTAGCTRACPGRFWISPEKETQQSLQAACSCAPSPS